MSRVTTEVEINIYAPLIPETPMMPSFHGSLMFSGSLVFQAACPFDTSNDMFQEPVLLPQIIRMPKS